MPWVGRLAAVSADWAWASIGNYIVFGSRSDILTADGTAKMIIRNGAMTAVGVLLLIFGFGT